MKQQRKPTQAKILCIKNKIRFIYKKKQLNTQLYQYTTQTHGNRHEWKPEIGKKYTKNREKNT
jgi:hypothetical protein